MWVYYSLAFEMIFDHIIGLNFIFIYIYSPILNQSLYAADYANQDYAVSIFAAHSNETR